MKQILFYLSMMLCMYILVMLMILISVAFLTLLERKLLGYIQLRKGPNKLGESGMLQSISDAIKLLIKEFFFMSKSNMIYYLITPMFMFMMIFMMWLIYPFFNNLLSLDLGVIYLMCCFSLSSYSLLISGWSSNSSYSMLGAIRSLAQAISYEVSFSIIMISPFIILESFNMKDFLMIQNDLWLGLMLMPLLLIFFFSVMAELNRTPFDFSEGESELVSGFNVEYMSGSFILIFLSEYASILFMSMLLTLMFLGGDYYKIMFYIKILMVSYFIIWLRGSLPRFRYDLLMYLCWLMILPMSLGYMLNIYLLKIIFFF